MVDSIQNLQPSSCSSGTCAPPADRQYRTPIEQAPESVDTVKISKQGREQSGQTTAAAAAVAGAEDLDAEQQSEVDDLKRTDQEVKAHERAHMAAGAGLVMGGANYQYQRGPDGNMYAVSGEVKIDTSREKDPKDTIRKMQQVKRAALAPAQPSGQDRSVAARASQIEAQARVELLKQNSDGATPAESTDMSSTNTIRAENLSPYQSSPNEPTIKVVA